MMTPKQAGVLALLAALMLIGPGLRPAAQSRNSPVAIHVHADQIRSPWPQTWNYFGYDEPNYTYAPNGQKLLGELASLSPAPIYVRTHNLFTSGDGSASLKWGSTNVYTEDAAGDPVYDWKIVDRIFDTFHRLGIVPIVELGFMPEALSTNPKPYRHNFPNGTIYTGWAYPPKDYKKWSELVFHFVQHLKERYGETETRAWLWEVWNEPDIGYWKGTQSEYFELYDYSADSVRRALPGALIGGPETTGPLNDNSGAQFLRAFLQHCSNGRNFATEKAGAPLDFISFHPKGSPVLVDGHVRMGPRNQLAVMQRGFEIVRSFPEWKNTPIVFGESDPEGCAACSARTHPANAYRNGQLFAVYTAAILNQTLALAGREHVNFRGAVTWSFEFEGQPYFEGFRDLATNGIDKPVLNAFRMFGLLEKDRLDVESDGAVSLDEFLKAGVREQPDIDAIATRGGRSVSVLVWNYHDDDLPAPDSPVNLTVSGVPGDAKTVLVEQFRVDATHSNSYTAWQRLGSPQEPTPDEYRLLERSGQLQQLGSPEWKVARNSEIQLQLSLPRNALALLRISW
jgi:xylan 1,4-beta-xylosidase